MYEQYLSRANPGCIIIMVDRSESMQRPWAGTTMTLAQGAARAVNKILIELCVKCIKESGGAPRDYFHIGIIGYGYRMSDHGQGVESAFGGALTGRGIVPIRELAQSSLGMVEEPSADPNGPRTRLPVWVEPVAGYQTPMCEAFETVGRLIHRWTKEHPSAFPPVCLNLTDGEDSQGTHRGANLQTWADRVKSVSTTDGQALVLTAFLSPQRTDRTEYFPSTPQRLPHPGPALFYTSSELPAPMVRNARSLGIPVTDGARGLLFNADMSMLVDFLKIGTQLTVRDY